MYLAGDTFLAHFYSSYNFEDNTISIGINTHSEGLAFISEPDVDDMTEISGEAQEVLEDAVEGL